MVCILAAGTPVTYLHHAEPVASVTVAADAPDTLDVAIVASARNGAVSSSAPVRSMSASGIARSGARNLDEVIRTFAGISVKDYGGIGGLKTVSIRSLGAQHTAICYDGITISDAQNGQVDIGRFNLDNIANVSVSVAGTDDIFRSARHLTSSGILEIMSVKPDFSQGPVQAMARMDFASFGTYSPYLLYSQRLANGWSLGASANCLFSKGDYPFVLRNGTVITDEKRLNSDVASINSEINLHGDMGRGGELSLKAMYTGSERGLPGTVILYTQNPTERLWDRILMSSVSYGNTIADAWKIRASVGYCRAYNRYLNSDPAYQVPEDDRYTQQEYTVSAILQFRPAERLRIVLAEDFFVNSLDSSIPECPFPMRYSTMTALSARYSSERFTAVAGMVWTYSHETVRAFTPAPDRKRLSPFASLSYRLMKEEDLRIRLSFKDGFRVPTFNDLYYARVGNVSLMPEKALQANLGLAWQHDFRGGSLSLTADTYYNNVKDKIIAVPTMFIWKMRNAGKVQMAGADITASLHYVLAEWLSIDTSAGYSFQYAVDVTDPGAKNYMHQIPYTPRHSGNLTAAIGTPWLTLSYIMTAAGERFSLAQNIPANRIAPYADHGLSAGRAFVLGRRHRYEINIAAQALNLGNINYEIIKYYPMPGRHFRLTFKLSY